ncbi:MAG TPA: alpha/beta fold hydrolase [Candidatus Competibacter sp.]|nr:alpha/beta fold hydrolase [Candidatus Competibacter sp.]
MRAHRSFRLLAASLTRKGYHVLRMDYRGTGDSAGDLEEYLPADWAEDISMAVGELRDSAGIQRVGLLGLRLGALLAAEVAAGRDDITFLVAWDPLISGDVYLRELRDEIALIPQDFRHDKQIDERGYLHFNGFAMTPGFQRNLQQFDMSTISPQASRILQVVSHETDDFARLRGAWSELPGYQYRHVPAPYNWNYVDYVGGIMLPLPILTAIVDWL